MATARYKYTTSKQVGGDDGYCYRVTDTNGRQMDGLTRREASYYRKRWENEIRDQRGEEKIA